MRVTLASSLLVAIALSGCAVSEQPTSSGFPPIGLEAMEAALAARTAASPVVTVAPTPARAAPTQVVVVAPAQPHSPVLSPAPAAVAPAVAASSSSPVVAFMTACVQTAQAPHGAAATLQSLGFRPSGNFRGAATFEAPYATAAIAPDTRTGGAGQCTVTPRSSTFAATATELNAAMQRSGLTATKLPGEEAWVLGSTGAVVLVSRSGGAMTRSQPGVFRG